MKVGAIQSCFIPWRGYFDFIASVDMFVFYDDVQYSKNGWRNRNKIKTPTGVQWLTVPVQHIRLDQLVSEICVGNSIDWRKKHYGSWQANYSRSTYYKDVMELLSNLWEPKEITISKINIELAKRICQYLGISTQLILSSDLSLSGTKTARLIDLLKKLGASTYLSGASADVYLDKEAFRANGIRLEYKSYDYDPYPQLWGPFEGAVTVLDLIANCGPQSKERIRSTAPDRIIIP